MDNTMDEWISVKDEMPPPGSPVLCQLQGCFTGQVVEFELVHVKEDDCSWRTADDNSEVSYDWDVIAWLRSASNPKADGHA